jgi:Spy/CpxP family protein refolding chaperone
MLIATARESGVLEAQQKDLDKIEQTLGAGPREEHKAFTDDLVAAVKAGTVDPAKLAPRLDALEKALAARRDKELAAITATHKLLTPTQRTALVTTLRSRLGAKPSDAHGKGGFGAELGKRRLERMTTELELDAAQQKKIEAAIGDGKPEETARGDIEKRIDTLLVAFEAELFDASKLDLGDAGKRMREGLDRHLAFVAAVVPVLKPEQRDRFAASLARGPRGMGPDVGLGGFHGDEAAPPPADAKSADAKPADAKSADAKPGDAKSEAKDAKPADAKK